MTLTELIGEIRKTEEQAASKNTEAELVKIFVATEKKIAKLQEEAEQKLMATAAPLVQSEPQAATIKVDDSRIKQATEFVLSEFKKRYM